jgi:hypothetical protein
MTGKWTSILIGALTYVFLGTLLSTFGAAAGGFGAILSCLVVLGSAAVAVWHYTTTNELTITGGEGAGMGALTGLIGAVIAGILGYFLISIGAVPDPMDAAIEQMREQGLTEEQIEQGMGMAEMFSSPVIGIVVGAVFGLIGGAIGGAVGAALFKKGGPDPTPREAGL